MDTRAIIEQYFAAVNAADWDTWLSLFTDDAIMDDALSPRMEGKDALRASTEQMSAGFKSFNNRLVESVVEGDRGMVICRIEAVTGAGVPIESTGANFYRIENGKIAYMASFHDSAPFIAAFSAGAGASASASAEGNPSGES